MKKPIYVTEPFMPPLEEVFSQLKGIWDRKWLTNQGPLVRELESKLQHYHTLETPVHCLANCGLGLQIALKALGIKGEVITTPFSYVATSSCPLWEGCTLRFADIDPQHLTIDADAVEAAITPATEAIMATHVFGNACEVEKLERIARKHGLAIIYDAAHAFGVRHRDKSLLAYGDVSVVSTHATKLFHTVEGGFFVATDDALSEKMEQMRRFGHNGPYAFHGIGINAKMSELHAAIGLTNLQHMDRIIESRKRMCQSYEKTLFSEGSPLSPGIRYRAETTRNYSYFPVLFESEAALLEAVTHLEANAISPRRYFYPHLNDVFPQASAANDCPHARSITPRILCLPLSSNYGEDVVRKVVSLLVPSKS
ncbi:MAG: DegT/DnrJ/EryC1/StrS family aminotransferase [Puniceicoccales bacterium]